MAHRDDEVHPELADPTRRAVVERLNAGPATVRELAEPFTMALPSFTQHLRLLEACGLLRSRKRGRQRVCRLATGSLRAVEHWLARRRALWERHLDQLDAYLLNFKEKNR